MTRTVFAHGCWDGLHIGHVRHLQAAAALGDRLVVGVTADAAVGKGPGRPRYTDVQRAASVSALACVDHVEILHDPIGYLELVRPAVYAKGKEYEGRDCPDFQAAREVGCEVVFVGDTLGSSSAALNQDAELDPFIAACRQKYNASDVDEAFAKIAAASVYVIGDGISDVYVPCEVVGMTSKGGAPVVRQTGEAAKHAGGAWAIRNHAAALGAGVDASVQLCVTKTRYYSLAGGQMRTHVAVEQAITPSPVLLQWPMPEDLFLVGDFGHGAIVPGFLTAINRHGHVAVTCQTNALNVGLNIITRRYHRVGLFVVDDREFKLARHSADPNPKDLVVLREGLSASRAYWTRGERETVSSTSGRSHSCPALESHPIDPLGAGDAFFTVAALCWHVGLPEDLSLLLAQIAGAQMTRVLGNARPLDKDAMMRTAKAILA